MIHLQGGIRDSVYRIGPVALVKGECRGRSVLLTTQKNKRTTTRAFDIDLQIQECRGAGIIGIFSAQKKIPVLGTRIRYLDTVTFIENRHTESSVNESTEYFHVFFRGGWENRARGFVERLRRRVDHAAHPPMPVETVVERFYHDPSLSETTLTENQKNILEAWKDRAGARDPFYFNAGCSRDFSLYVGPLRKGYERHANGKLGSMTCPILWDGACAFKASPAGCFWMRGIPIPTGCNERGNRTRMRNIARHGIHPEYVGHIRAVMA